MEKYNVIISNQAEKELNNIINYINSVLLEPNTAKKLLDKFKTAINNLKNLPEKYARISDEYIVRNNIRKCLVDNYVIIYTINLNLKRVEISHIFYARRNWMKLI